MDYREHTPCPRLRPFIQCYWTLRIDAPSPLPPHRVFPDGAIEIIFHFGEPFERIHDNGTDRQRDTLLAGQIWFPVILRPSPRADVLGIRFRPAGAGPFLRFPLNEVGGRIHSLEDFWGARARSIRDAVAESPHRIAALERCLLALNPEPLAPLAALSERQYRRRFEAAVGIAPKLHARIRRFQFALTRIGSVPFADAAAASGYADQSHLIRDFKQFTGLTPSAWLRERNDVRFFQDALAAEALL